MPLTSQQIEQYRTDGFLIFPELFSQEEVQRLLRRLEEYVEETRPKIDGLAFQVEPVVQKGVAVAESKMAAFRKVEGLARLDSLYRDFSRHPRLLDILTSLLGPDIKLFRDALMMKPAHHGSAKPYHQDSAYWTIDPPDLASVWMALDDATLENGCMRVLPGSHTWGVMEHKHLEDYQVEEDKLDRTKEVAVPLRAGGCLVFHSLLLHATSPNESDRSRRAMITSYMSAKSRFLGEPKPDFMQISGQSYEGCV
jgi:hypothetical protein